MSRSSRQRPVKAPRTPIRRALKADSALLGMVKVGLGAVSNPHRIFFDDCIRPCFADSLDVDAAFKEGREQEHRWDYLLGHRPTGRIVGVEPHSAENSEISTVIKKRTAALRQLHNHLREGVRVSKWLWVASGRVHFAPLEKATLLLAQSGIEFVGKKITGKHLA